MNSLHRLQERELAPRMVINASILSMLKNALLFRLLLGFNHLSDAYKFFSHAWPGLLLLEWGILSCIKMWYTLDTNVKSSGFTTPAGRKPFWARDRWKEKFGCAKLFILSLVFYAFICFVLGAPLDRWEETIFLAHTLTTLTIFPIMLLIGQSRTYQLLLSEKLELNSVLANDYLKLLKSHCLGVILGAWGGSVVAPLDWDRPWQVYPIPNVFGSIIGLSAMNVFNLSTTYIRLYRIRKAESI